MPWTLALRCLELLLSSIGLMLARYRQLRLRRQERRRKMLRWLRLWLSARGVRGLSAEEALIRMLLRGEIGRVLALGATAPEPPLRTRRWWSGEVLQSWEEEAWVRHFRMPKKTLLGLASLLKPHMPPATGALTAEEKVAMALWWLSRPLRYQKVAQRFQVKASTAATVCLQVVQALERGLLRRTVRMGGHRQIMDGFKRLGFPNCVGAVDWIHVPIRPSRESAEKYYNKKYEYSILMQQTTLGDLHI